MEASSGLARFIPAMWWSLPGLALLIASAVAAAGCLGASGGPSFDVDARNDSAAAVEMGFRATFDDTGEVVLEESAVVQPGETKELGHLRGPRGDYSFRYWAGDSTGEQGPGWGLDSAGLGCQVLLAEDGRLDLLCDVA